MLEPVHGAAEEPPLVAGLRRGELGSALVQRLPVRQARTGVLGPHRIPPVLARDGLMCRHVLDPALFHCRAEGRPERAFPDFRLEGDVAEPDRFIDRLAVGRYVLDVVPLALEYLADDMGHHDLAGPVVDRRDDRIGQRDHGLAGGMGPRAADDS